jgi:hypothetical protein
MPSIPSSDSLLDSLKLSFRKKQGETVISSMGLDSETEHSKPGNRLSEADLMPNVGRQSVAIFTLGDSKMLYSLVMMH